MRVRYYRDMLTPSRKVEVVEKRMIVVQAREEIDLTTGEREEMMIMMNVEAEGATERGERVMIVGAGKEVGIEIVSEEKIEEEVAEREIEVEREIAKRDIGMRIDIGLGGVLGVGLDLGTEEVRVETKEVEIGAVEVVIAEAGVEEEIGEADHGSVGVTAEIGEVDHANVVKADEVDLGVGIKEAEVAVETKTEN